MPPKNKGNADDKTFGLKNKNKSSKVQKYVAMVEQQAASSGKNKAALAKEKEKEKREAEKKAELAKKKMELELFKPAQIQKLPFGTDPKTVLCVFFKAGHCEKGNKCKFSHDLDVGRKVDKANIYADTREAKSKDLMETWDEAKLREVVNQQGSKQKNATDIVCKYFIQAIEDRKYGWFWECPNGGDKCMYRHALPPGFVLKSEKKAAEEAAKKEQISLEEFLEVERHKLKPPLTPVTTETFAAWKKNRIEKKAAEAEAMEKAKAAQRAAGKMTGMTGKDMFEFGGELYDDADEGEDEDWDISRMLARYREEEGRPEGYDEPPDQGYRGEDEGADGGVDEAAKGVNNLAVENKA